MRSFLFALLLLVFPLTSAAQERVAFVVGNGVYEHATPLANPTNDAVLIGRTLEDLGFKVYLHQNLSRLDISAELRDFLRETEGAETTLFYFAGHGMQFEGRNYLLGTDARLESELDIEAEALDLEQITRLLRRNSRAALFFIDACRDNPLATDFYRENFSSTRALMNRGLAAPSASFEGAMVTFAASPGQVAYDGAGAHSPFANALARHLPTPNTEVLTLMKRVTRDVKNDTGDRQIPMVSNDLTREIYLSITDDDQSATITLAQEEAMFEAALSLESERAWDIFLDRYPQGQLYAAALNEREELQARRLAEKSGTKLRDGEPISVSRDIAIQAETDLGMAHSDARNVQVALNERGFPAGPEDGLLGTRSRKAIADFQAAVGLPSTGVVTKGTASALGLTIETPEESDRPVIASQNARRYDYEQLALVESDPRLIEAARILKGKEFVYGFFENRLYIAVLTWNSYRFERALELAEQVGGHMATIGTAAENQFVYNLVRYDERLRRYTEDRWDKFGPAFGIYQTPNSREPSGGFVWHTGEPVTYTNWLNTEPNNYDNNERIVTFHFRPPGPSRVINDGETGATWGDLPDVERGFVIEIE